MEKALLRAIVWPSVTATTQTKLLLACSFVFPRVNIMLRDTDVGHSPSPGILGERKQQSILGDRGMETRDPCKWWEEIIVLKPQLYQLEYRHQQLIDIFRYPSSLCTVKKRKILYIC